MTELKPCPFCGGKAKLVMVRSINAEYVIKSKCSKCYAETEGYCPNLKDEDKAISIIFECIELATKAWNRRVGNETNKR